MSQRPAPPERLFTYDFTVLTLAATFGFCNIAVFYGLASHLEKLGLDPAWRGAVIAAEPLAAFLSRPFLSVWLTARRALAMARLSMAGMGVALALYQFADTLPSLLAVRVFHGLTFVCLVSAVMVLLTKVVRPAQAGRAFGYFSLSSLLPYALMPPLAEWLLPRVGGEAQAYAWTALMVLPALALMIPLGARLGREAFSHEVGRGPSRADIRENLSRPPVLLILGANLMVFAGSTQVFFFVKQYAVGLGVADPGLFFTVSTSASIAARLLAGPFYDRLPRRTVASAALAALGCCILLFAAVHGPAPFFLLAGCYGFLLGLALPPVNAAMFLESEPRFRGMNMNLMLFMMDAGYVLGPLAGGLVVAGPGGFPALFAAGAACAVAGAGLLAPLAAKEWRGQRVNGERGAEESISESGGGE